MLKVNVVQEERLDLNPKFKSAVALFLGSAVLAGGLGYVAHPHLVDMAISFFDIGNHSGMGFMKVRHCV